MSRFRVHLAAPISGLPAYLEPETIYRLRQARNLLVAANDAHPHVISSLKEDDGTKLQATLREARFALESARSYRFVEIDGSPLTCFTDATPGWINLEIEATSQTESDLVTDLCAICNAVTSQHGGSSITDAYSPWQYLRPESTRFLVPNRLVASFQEIGSGSRS